MPATERFVVSLSCVVVDPVCHTRSRGPCSTLRRSWRLYLGRLLGALGLQALHGDTAYAEQVDIVPADSSSPGLRRQVVWLGEEASGRGPADLQDVSRVASGATAFPGACCFNHELELHTRRGFTCTPVEAQLSVLKRTKGGAAPLGTATLSVAPAGDGTLVVRHLTLEQCAPSLRRGTQLRVAVRVQPAGKASLPDEPWFMPDVPSAGDMPCRTASAGSDSVASAESSDGAEGDQQVLPPVTSAPLHHDRRRGLARLFGKRRGKKAGAAAASPDATRQAQESGGQGTTVSNTSSWFFAGWLARGSQPPVEGPSGCLSVGGWTADAQSQEPEGPTPAAADSGDAPSPPGSGRFARGSLLRGFGGSRSDRVVHHSRSASAPAEAMAAPRSLLLGNDDEDAFQRQLTQALAASSLATLPAHMRMKRRRPGRNSAHPSSGATLAPSATQSGVATPSGASLHEHKKVHSSNVLLQHGGDDGDLSDALHGDAPPSPSCPSSQPWLLTPLREGSLPCAGEWLHLELALPDSDPAAAPLAADVFFASIDQRSAEAGGSGACACTAVALAAWLETHPADLPVGRGGGELDDLIRDGSATWRELRRNSAASALAPDGHFDLITALGQAPSRLHAVPGASFVAFMAPPTEALARLEQSASEALQGLLKGAPSLDAALRSAHGEARPGRPATAVVSLLDHHSCVRLCASGECVLVDTLGERLYEANTKAFLMRFCSLDDLVTFMQRIVAGPRLQALGPADLANGAHKLQVDVQVVRKSSGEGESP